MIAAVRARGKVKVRRDLEYTMELLRLYKVNHLVIVEEKMLAMLKKVESFVTFGEINTLALEKLLKKRGRLSGNKRLSEEFLKKNKLKSFKELSEKILNGEVTLKSIGIKPVFRLNSPRKGYERAGIKKPFKIGGVLGYRGEKINLLIEKMV